jgi:transcriptional regulator with XRE-family HTH domain
MNIGARLRILRTQYGISERALASKAGLVSSQINKIEHNVTKPSIDSLERICSALDLTLSDFFAQPDLSPVVTELINIVKKLPPEKVKPLIEIAKQLKG